VPQILYLAVATNVQVIDVVDQIMSSNIR